MIENDLQATIEMRLSQIPSGTTWIDRPAGRADGIEVAFLDANGATLRIDHYTRPRGQLYAQTSPLCR